MARVIKAALSDAAVVSFSAHQSRDLIDAQIAQIAAALVEKATPENDVLLDDGRGRQARPWPVKKKHAVLIVHEGSVAAVVEKASEVKRWLVQNTLLVEEQVVVQPGASHAEEGMDAAGMDVDAATEVDCVLLLQSNGVLYRPACLVHLVAAIRADVPIVPVVLTSSNWRHGAILYSFEQAHVLLQNMGGHMPEADIASVEKATLIDIEAVGYTLVQPRNVAFYLDAELVD